MIIPSWNFTQCNGLPFRIAPESPTPLMHRGELRLSHRPKAQAHPEKVHLLHRLDETSLDRRTQDRNSSDGNS